MKIGFDARYISHGLTGGVRTYVYHLARELPCVAPEHQFYFYADAKAPFELTKLPDNVVLRVLPWNGPLSSIRNDLLLGRYMQRDRVDVVHCPGNYGPRVSVPLVMTLHDTLNLFPMSQHLSGFGRHPRKIALMMYLGRKTRSTLQHAHRIITDSNHACADIASRTSYPVNRIRVIYPAASDDFRIIHDREVLDRFKTRHALRDRIILADGIKNPQATIDAYRALPSNTQACTNLVFFSRESRPRPEVAVVLDNPRVRFIAQPPTADLVLLMNLATVLAFPSLYEGFGLPLVEAMQCGVPIVASSRGSIPEIVQHAGLIFDLEAPHRFATQLAKVLENDDVRRELSAKARARAQHFSWAETARQTVGVYEDVATRSEVSRIA